MAELFEKHKSRNGRASPDNPTLDVVYGVIGTDDETEVDDLVDAGAPSEWNGLIRQGWSRDYLGVNLWEVTVNYSREETKGAGALSFSGDTSGGTQHVTQSIRTVCSGAVDKNGDPVDAPDCHRAIGVTEDGVEGVDVVVPKLEFTITVIADSDALPSDYLVQLHKATGMCNDATFSIDYRGQHLEFNQGELLFMGCPFSYRGNGTWEFPFKFSASRNAEEEDILIGGVQDPDTLDVTGGIQLVEKQGWDYLWIKYSPKKSNDAIVRQPTAAYIEQVVKQTDFDALFGIPFTV